MKISTVFDTDFGDRGVNVWFNTLGHTEELINQFTFETQSIVDASPLLRSDAVKHDVYEKILGEKLTQRVKRTGFELFIESDITIRKNLAATSDTEYFQDPLLNMPYGGVQTNMSYVNLLQHEVGLINSTKLLYLSGGIDSEVVASILLDGQIDFVPIIFRWVDCAGIVANAEDIQFAEAFCIQHNMTPVRYEINLSQLWESSEFAEYMAKRKFRSPQLATYSYMVDKTELQHPGALHLFGGEVRYVSSAVVFGQQGTPSDNLVFASKQTIPYVFKTTTPAGSVVVSGNTSSAYTKVQYCICGGGGGGGTGILRLIGGTTPGAIASGPNILEAYGGGGGGGGRVVTGSVIGTVSLTSYNFAYTVGGGGMNNAPGGGSSFVSTVPSIGMLVAVGGGKGSSKVLGTTSNEAIGGASDAILGGAGPALGQAYAEIKTGTPYLRSVFDRVEGAKYNTPDKLAKLNVVYNAYIGTSTKLTTVSGVDVYGLGRAPDVAGLLWWTDTWIASNPVWDNNQFYAQLLALIPVGTGEYRRSRTGDKTYIPGKHGGDFIDMPKDATTYVAATYGSGGGGAGATGQGFIGIKPLDVASDYKGAGGEGGWGMKWTQTTNSAVERIGGGGGGGSACTEGPGGQGGGGKGGTITATAANGSAPGGRGRSNNTGLKWWSWVKWSNCGYSFVN